MSSELHVSEWKLHLFLSEEGDVTKANARLETGTNTLYGRGVARRNPHDAPVPEIGDEVAAGRALVDLGRQLMGVAAADIEAVEGGDVHLAERSRAW
jgi:hypothetical protein